ncbi:MULTISPECIES: shikimate dehydrogenase [Marisediminitalea]|uniref:shikimate dehydrogenase n=1 Tax=Marisediminitalea TaxID=2662254 RepID=UPI0020CF6067|nr:shikimate dehydrogenase [Marisediminitalea aggregata]MCP3863193.1 shikimate dehydrogenase [Aestuariibacter sp.]MCP4237657.1 shikimate dehydrogenase [Aestuariibacter sp.]MCP4524593.1 shikimate dehydrogenase [Aestuariibacter sp.]MCP4948620.1 shikimate dehydrogenase [Aestuariibacter sp.]MCP5012971.1 shikimate dehydrogenase [Aestuariibacter sp.]
MKKYAVFGNPIAQSLSPTIHTMFAKSLNLDLQYDKILAPLDGFSQSIKDFFADVDALGCNVTVPFKEQAFQLADLKDNAATMAKAANTLMYNDKGQLCAFNTDGVGLVADLIANGNELKNAKILLLGAGGAARGVVHPLLAAGVDRLDILNRTIAKADAIASESNSNKVSAISKQSLAEHYDIVINSTSASLEGRVPDVPESVFVNCKTAYDMVYAKEPTSFLNFAGTAGAQNQLDGLGMLVEQAAAAFAIWTGKQPNTLPVIQFLRQR